MNCWLPLTSVRTVRIWFVAWQGSSTIRQSKNLKWSRKGLSRTEKGKAAAADWHYAMHAFWHDFIITLTANSVTNPTMYERSGGEMMPGWNERVEEVWTWFILFEFVDGNGSNFQN